MCAMNRVFEKGFRTRVFSITWRGEGILTLRTRVSLYAFRYCVCHRATIVALNEMLRIVSFSGIDILFLSSNLSFFNKHYESNSLTIFMTIYYIITF